MKFKSLQRALDKAGSSLFAKGKPLSFLYQLYDAADTFFFSTNQKTTGSVHVRDCNDLKRAMFTVVLALIPCALFGIFNVGYQANLLHNQCGAVPGGWHGTFLLWLNGQCPGLRLFDYTSVLGCFLYGLVYYLPVYIVTMIVGIFWEVVFATVYKHEVNEGFFVTGFLFPLICPATIPLWQVALAISFGVVIGKEIFGGTGRNFLNPALVARAFLFFAYAGQITGDKVWTAVDGVSKATPLSYASEGAQAIVGAGYQWYDAFLGLIPGAVGETSTVCCLIGAAVLLTAGIASWRIMGSMFVGGMGLAWIFSLCGSNNPAMNLGPWWHFVLGGFAFGMVFMATDPISAAQTRLGQYIYGLLVGALVIVVRVFNPAYPEGCMLVILFGNCVAPLIDHFVVEANVRRRMKRLQAR
ncbi:MAG: NADH:ubiquinone reductase (Na(+)-transporting) subunit B [Thermoguttaceae bacterium]|nr:NADH:ubiquinone reductase (Na(+)-transporting) subunit B [Thermoguttaceae bacterium]